MTQGVNEENTIRTQAKNALAQKVRERFGKPIGSVKSFKELATKTKLSSQTLRRFFGKIDKNYKVSESTLSLLCNYVGYVDWETFVVDYIRTSELCPKDKASIDNMHTFFHNGQKHNMDYEHNTLSVDTLTDYAKIVHKNEETLRYFYKLYKDNEWASNYVFGCVANYSHVGKEPYRTLLNEMAAKTSNGIAKVVHSCFLYLGDFLSMSTTILTPSIEEINTHFENLPPMGKYYPLVKMRYTTILLMEAYQNNQTDTFNQIYSDFLNRLDRYNLNELNKAEVIFAFCNSLLWMKKYDLAYELLKDKTSFLKKYNNANTHKTTLRFTGLNIAYIKTTFYLTWAMNDLDPSAFDLKDEDFCKYFGRLSNDYIRIMYLVGRIKTETKSKQDDLLEFELKPLINETNYYRALSLL